MWEGTFFFPLNGNGNRFSSGICSWEVWGLLFLLYSQNWSSDGKRNGADGEFLHPRKSLLSWNVWIWNSFLLLIFANVSLRIYKTTKKKTNKPQKTQTKCYAAAKRETKSCFFFQKWIAEHCDCLLVFFHFSKEGVLAVGYVAYQKTGFPCNPVLAKGSHKRLHSDLFQYRALGHHKSFCWLVSGCGCEELCYSKRFVVWSRTVHF